MAKFQYTKFLGEFGVLKFDYDEQTLALDEGGTSKSATFTDSSGDHIVFKGTGLKYGEPGITAGTIEKIIFENSDGQTMVTMSDGDFDAKSLTHTLIDIDGVEIFLDKIMSGKDTVIGSGISDFLSGGMKNDTIDGGGGVDTLYGGKGNDLMHGGAGSDTFLFSPGDDTVDDFDANGGGGKQDYINGHKEDFTITKSGDDVVVESIESHYTLTLLHVKVSEITDADFHLLA